MSNPRHTPEFHYFQKALNSTTRATKANHPRFFDLCSAQDVHYGLLLPSDKQVLFRLAFRYLLSAATIKLHGCKYHTDGPIPREFGKVRYRPISGLPHIYTPTDAFSQCVEYVLQDVLIQEAIAQILRPSQTSPNSVPLDFKACLSRCGFYLIQEATPPATLCVFSVSRSARSPSEIVLRLHSGRQYGPRLGIATLRPTHTVSKCPVGPVVHLNRSPIADVVFSVVENLLDGLFPFTILPVFFAAVAS